LLIYTVGGGKNEGRGMMSRYLICSTTIGPNCAGACDQTRLFDQLLSVESAKQQQEHQHEDVDIPPSLEPSPMDAFMICLIHSYSSSAPTGDKDETFDVGMWIDDAFDSQPVDTHPDSPTAITAIPSIPTSAGDQHSVTPLSVQGTAAAAAQQ
jgi:hypothetical protein